MANGSTITEDDPDLGQGDSGGGPPGDPSGAPQAGPPGAPGPGGMLAAMARNRQGPQISAPGPGNQADAMNKLNTAIHMIQEAALGLLPGSPLHRDALRAASSLSRHLGGAGGMAPAAGIQKTQLGDMFRDTVKSMLLQKIMGQRGQGGAPGGAAQPPPMPSTPLPGS